MANRQPRGPRSALGFILPGMAALSWPVLVWHGVNATGTYAMTTASWLAESMWLAVAAAVTVVVVLVKAGKKARKVAS
jgi:hypothetical protein